MLEYLKGKVTSADETSVTIETNGMGFRVRVMYPERFSGMAGKKIVLWTALDVQPRRWTVYGFQSIGERLEFSELWRIPGIGPMTAMKLMPHLEGIRKQGAAGLPDLPGIGPAKRARLLKWLKVEEKASSRDSARETAAALVALGVPPAEARSLASRVAAKYPDASLEKMVRLAVKRR
jgi:Holliday junction resolvasome RuvABC DNA-binding subunit